MNTPIFFDLQDLISNTIDNSHKYSIEKNTIAVYDSGVGGLTIVKELEKFLPNFNILYLADNAWFPYGTKSELDLIRRVNYLVDKLISDVKPSAIIVACNTASTAISSRLSAANRVPLFGVSPPITEALRSSSTKQIVLLATPSTIQRKGIRKVIAQTLSLGQVSCIGSIELVKLAEEKLAGEKISVAALEKLGDQLIPPNLRNQIDTIILGCTHFPHMEHELKILFPNVKHFINPAYKVAQTVSNFLSSLKITSTNQKTGNRFLFLTSTHNFQEMKKVFSAYGFTYAWIPWIDEQLTEMVA